MKPKQYPRRNLNETYVKMKMKIENEDRKFRKGGAGGKQKPLAISAGIVQVLKMLNLKFWKNRKSEKLPDTSPVQKSASENFFTNEDWFITKLVDEIATEQNKSNFDLSKLIPKKISDLQFVKADGVAMNALPSSVAPLPEVNNEEFRTQLLNRDINHFAESFIGYTACGIISQNKTIQIACEKPAKDAISAGYKLEFENKEIDQHVA